MTAPEKTQGERPLWAIRDCAPVMVEVVGVRRAWYHLRSGTTEWKEQSPRLYASESQAAWSCLVQELGYSLIRSWQDGHNKRPPFDSVDSHRLADRVHLHCCRYHRAWQNEIRVSNGQQATRADAAEGGKQ